MPLTRRTFIVASAAALAAPRLARATGVSDATGRTLAIPAKVSRVFPAGPPAAILLYTLAPDLLLGWPRANRPEECAYMLPEVCARPEIGRLTGRGNTANLETVIALKPDLILDVGSTRATFVSLAERVQAQTGIPYALLDGRFDAIPDTYRKLGALVHREADAKKLADYSEHTLEDDSTAHRRHSARQAPARLLRARPARAGDGPGRLDQRGDHRAVGAERRRRHAWRAGQCVDRAGAAVEPASDRHHRPVLRRHRARRSRPGRRSTR